MIELFTSVLVNYAGFVDSFIGLDYVVGFSVVVAAFAFIYSLGHKKSF